ncbi:GNAT family N-acetyltransferase [Aspergillus saccharolyticus JOP 1030-1]|uniref:Acyl-CoA N-acyltransferase n=1 Tax=Aspergillus saccharolyticus JOP 1030-1 TaxID=1450539 RepID=A0A318ZZ42_9EURO|nr:acyl-CoA N-acyltransferase [Aspergillus saccharolyticus JOP 1030-1]PYH49480.1 acyl-CoA N-acyltransferase [Aspergillus saccharolyticus JOP 1030-1]
MYKPASFTTPRLLFEAMTPSDLEAMHEIRNKTEVMRWSMRKLPDQNLEETRSWLTKYLSGEDQPPRMCYVIREVSPDGTAGPVIGNMGVRMEPAPSQRDDPNLKTLNSPEEGAEHHSSSTKDRWELGYIFHPSVWGRGYATEAVQHLSQQFFGEVQAQMAEAYGAAAVENVDEGLWAITNHDNAASKRVLVKTGFRGPVEEFIEGDGTRCNVFRKDGISQN